MDWGMSFDEMDLTGLTPPRLEDEARRLYVPGRLYQLQSPTMSANWTIFEIEADQLFHVMGTKHMLKDHMPWQYELGLQHIADIKFEPARLCF
mmetsp:Transcript_1714/g.3356  ORF Transcript_1714/g.3356 Transcript_1714/m.3356 type:complete len:93 (-) Transcript_1714:731-1009(-)